MKRSKACVPALLAMLWSPIVASAEYGPYTPIPLQPGVNSVPGLSSDGQTGLIILAWRDNGNAWGYSTYTVMVPDRRAGWSLVGLDQPGTNRQFHDVIRDTPHTGEDAISAVRFVRGRLGGRPAVLLLKANRDWTADPYDPAPTTFEVYAIRVGEGPGTTVEYFARISQTVLPDRYCHAEMALSRATGLALPSSYEGKRTATGC